ncbi:MAG: serine/threonine protein kinase [Phycisphaeraceae bacterium]|nr:serine/threonine protein kinase [Phycisphaeraceae bacterium]
MLKLVSVKQDLSDTNASGVARLLAASSYLSDGELADVIVENCGSIDSLDLGLFLRAIPDLESRPVALDAAIEVTLQSMRRSGAEADEAAATLSRHYPMLATAIRTAHALGQAMSSTTSLAMASSERQSFTLPFDVGPILASGRPRYQLHQLLGIGSEGAVYLGQDRSLSEPGSPAWVAIKHVGPGAASEEAVRARKVLHANVVRALDRVPGPDGSWMLVFEFVRGGSLEKTWGGKTLPDRERAAAELCVQIARGVQAAHSAGLIHRDLKPGNVLLADDGTPKVSDFGISHNQANREISDRSGSLGFMSPEQFRGIQATVQDDVYGLGGLLYWMLTGNGPNGTTKQAATQRLVGGVNNSDLAQSLSPFDSDLAAICLRALSIEPEERYSSADRMAMDLELWLAKQPLQWTRPTLARRYRLSVRRAPIAWGAAGIGVIAVIAIVLIAGYRVGNAEVARERATIEMLSQRNSEQQQRLQTANLMTALMSKYLRNVSDDDMGANWVHILTFIESMMGSRSSADPTDTEQLWLSRVRVAKNAIAESRAKGHGDDLEPLMLESSLCLWLLRTKNGEEALEHLDAIEPRWRKMLQPDDEWFIFMDVFRRCAEMLVVDSNMPDASERRVALYAAAVDRSKTLGQTGRPVRMLLEKLKPIAYPDSAVTVP